MNYQEALDYIYGFLDPHRRPAATPQAAEQNLERMRALLAAAGDPQRHFPSVVVAGTKGKGSTCALIESITRAASYRSGLWTSPHLNTYRERFQIDRRLISQADLVATLEQLRPLIDGFDTATYGRLIPFEIGFALALRYFAAAPVDLAVLEIGLGGRYDSVNVITPLVSVISSISYDHMHVLGATLAEIADNKAGIMKPGVPAITVPQQPAAAAVLLRVSRAVGAPLWLAGPHGIARCAADATTLHDADPATFSAYPVAPEPQLLRGAFQHENARLALGAALLLRTRGLSLPDAALASGLATATWPGRLEIVAQKPTIVLDGAHNGDSARKLVAALRAEFQFGRLILVLGTSRDKDIPAIVAALAPAADQLVLTRSRHPRALADLDQMAAAVQPFAQAPPVLALDMPEALAAARRLASPDDLICVTGSLFVVGAAREALGLAESD